MKELILIWLKGPNNYASGRILYNKYGGNEDLKKIFAAGEFPKNKALLITALRNLLNPPVELKKYPVGSNGIAAVFEDLSQTDKTNPLHSSTPAKDDIVIKTLDDKWKPKYAEMNRLRYELDNYGTDNSEQAKHACNELCGRIKELEHECLKIWTDKEYYLAHGKLPATKEKKVEIPEDVVGAAMSIENLKKYIRRDRKSANAGDAKAAERLKKWLGAFKEITGNEYKFKN